MIRVTIEVDGYGHDFTIVRDEDLVTGALASERVAKLVAQAEAAMKAALRAVPE